MSRLYIIVFVGFISLVGIYNIFKSDITFSEGENRTLESFPEMTKDSIISGKFAEKFELYLTDNFKNKENWLVIKSLSEKYQMRIKSNGIYYGKNDYLFEEYRIPGEQLMKNLGYINTFSSRLDKDVRSYLLLAPTSIEVYGDYLPKYASSYSQKFIIDKVKKDLVKEVSFIDVRDRLIEENDSYLYFRTDHHWTMRGAYIAYLEASEVMGFKPYREDQFNLDIVSREFKGTYYSKVNLFGLKDDQIEVFNPKFETDIKIKYFDNSKVVSSLYNDDYLKKKDKYSYFLNGNHSLIELETNIKNGKKLVVVKDSYAHIFIPFLTYHYEEIHVVDMRYYKNSLKDYIDERDITEVLVLYNLVNFSEDSNLLWLKK